MQIFQDKKWISNAIYKPKEKESIFIDDYSDEAIAIKNGYDFEIENDRITIGEKIKDTPKEKLDKEIDNCETLNDIKQLLKNKLK